MPRLVTHTLRIIGWERQHEVISGRVVLQPAKGAGELEGFGEVGGRLITIPEVEGQASAVLGVTGRSTHLGPFLSSLIALRFDLKEDFFL